MAASQHRRDSSGEHAVRYCAQVSYPHLEYCFTRRHTVFLVFLASEHGLELTSNSCALFKVLIYRLLQLPCSFRSQLCPAASPFVQLQFEIHVLGALGAVIVGESTTFDGRVLAHVDAPGIIGVAGEKTGGADFDAVGPDVVVVVAVVPGISVGAHIECGFDCRRG